MIILCFDCETSGLPNPLDPPKLLQLGAILQDTDTDRVLSELNWLVAQAPGYDVPEAAVDVHGITSRLCNSYGFQLETVDGAFAYLLKMADRVVAHNIAYDSGIVRDNLPKSWSRYQDIDQYCTMQANTDILKLPHKTWAGRYKWPNLQETHKHYFGQGFLGAHDAMADIRATRDVYMEMLKRGMIHG